ncbi:hypothetical protein STCU_09262 [Strigomonas culicis]|uniref:Uncharacterized protein n=1 Tax=Strigomonas culicis TaxID=28005 RepID=S9TTE9_9TRYP|nr:hypothetical protein STCU_09262 [Strigomonas culicis]|eukprot:EPY19859.1 hypothetical protein STCU_09262 [Strigomonas culicis]
MQRVWEQLYGMQVLRLDGQEKFPQFTPTDATPEPTKETPAKQSKKKKKKVETTTPASPLSGTSIIVATLQGFLATDKRSAIWKHVYAFVTALLPSSDAPAPEEAYALLAALRQDAPQTGGSAMYERLMHHRWDCLGHCRLALVLALAAAPQTADPAATALLHHPLLQFINTTAAAAPTAAAQAPVAKPPAQGSGGTATVLYHTLEGKDRLLFLFALIKNLQKGKGLVVHVATKEMCYFLYNVVFYFLYHSPNGSPGSATSNDYGLPSYVRLLSDFEGEGSFSFSVKAEADKQRLVREFDGIIDAFHAGGEGDAKRRKKEVSAVLISCHALVPARGSIFVQYDCIPNIDKFNAFVCQQLSALPAAADRTPASAGQELCYAVRKRGRSTSPTPPPRSQDATAEKQKKEGAAPASGAHYPFIFLLTRPHETQPLLELLRAAPCSTMVTYKPLSSPPSLKGQFFFLGEDVVEANKHVFLLHNAAFSAYRNLMRVYCTLPPYQQLYTTLVQGGTPRAAAELSEKELVAQYQKHYRKFDWVKKIAEEFGFTEMPLLDLRLKKNEFRPMEDLFGAAQKAARIASQKYNAFAKEHIHPEVDSD